MYLESPSTLSQHPRAGNRRQRSLRRARFVIAIMAIIASFVATILLSEPASAMQHAASPTAQPTKIVEYDDLDLTRPAGVALLIQRTKRAARAVCRMQAKAANHPYARSPSCFRKTFAHGVRQIDRAVARAQDRAQDGARYAEQSGFDMPTGTF